MENRRDLLDFWFEDSERVGIGDHQSRDVFADGALDLACLDIAALAGSNRRDLETRQRGTGWIGAMGGVWNQNLVPVLAMVAMKSARDEQPGELALRARRRMERDRVHTRNLGQRGLELPHQAKRALRQMIRRMRMELSESLEAGHLVVDDRIVLHRA